MHIHRSPRLTHRLLHPKTGYAKQPGAFIEGATLLIQGDALLQLEKTPLRKTRKQRITLAKVWQ